MEWIYPTTECTGAREGATAPLSRKRLELLQELMDFASLQIPMNSIAKSERNVICNPLLLSLGSGSRLAR